jgi:hypothetical protein
LNDGIERYQGIANTIVQLFPFHGSVVMRSSLPSRQTVMKKSHLLILAVFAFLAFAAANAVAQQSSAGTAPVHAVVTVEAHKELENRCINTIRILSADAVQKANAFHHGNHGRVMVFAGRMPLKRNGKNCRRTGLSGGSREQDHTVAEAGAKAF